jgi:hypothetical protein
MGRGSGTEGSSIMARFLTVPVETIRHEEQLDTFLRGEYWDLLRHVALNMEGDWYTPPTSYTGPLMATPAPTDDIYAAGVEYCRTHNIILRENDPKIRDKAWGMAWNWSRIISLSEVQPEKIKFKYQRDMPKKGHLAKVIWHEIAHVEFRHGYLPNPPEKRIPKRQRELEAETVSYLLVMLFGWNRRGFSKTYIKDCFQKSHRLKETALKSENRVVDMVKMLIQEAQLGYSIPDECSQVSS